MKRFLIVALVIAALASLFVFGLIRGRPDRDITSNLLDKAVPNFNLPLFERYWSEYGERLDLASYEGKPRIVNFWASWCGPCYQEAPELQAAWQELKDDVLIIGVQTQDKGKKQQGQDFIDQFSLSFPNVIDDDSSTSVAYGLFGVPETFFIRADGTLAYKHVGPVSAAFLKDKIAEVF
ncbi:MAG: TlpA family protein disulfide reductase [Trueperaceae bacterium]|nr:TlpA family protein disulfide reductase [Trueperaceae bacterium]